MPRSIDKNAPHDPLAADPRYSSLIQVPTGVGGGKWYRFVGGGGDGENNGQCPAPLTKTLAPLN
jgi:hypothetical protein